MAGGWVKLPRQESPRFRQLPLVARAIAALLLKLTDDDGFIDLGTSDPKRMADLLKRSFGGDRYDLAQLRRHLPRLLASSAFWVKDDGLQAGVWAGYAPPNRAHGAASPLHTDGMPAACERPAGGIEEPKPAESQGPARRQTDRKNIQRPPVEAWEDIIVQEFGAWRDKLKAEWCLSRHDYKAIADAARPLLKASRQRSVPLATVVRASLRGYASHTDGRQRDYSLHFWAVDPMKYVRASSLQAERRAPVSEAEAEGEPMSYKDAVEEGLVSKEAFALLGTMGVDNGR